jgi:hypothetical protein
LPQLLAQRTLLERALKIVESEHGSDSLEAGLILSHLSFIYDSANETELADTCDERIHDILRHYVELHPQFFPGRFAN